MLALLTGGFSIVAVVALRMQGFLPETPLPTTPAFWATLPPTATPFRPLPLTGTFVPTPTATPTPTPVPTPTPLFGGRVVGLLLGSDRRPYEQTRYFRTDTIILAIYNPESGALSLISFPRDLYVHIPGIGYNRINVAMEFGGFPLLAQTFAENFGPRPEYYALVDLPRFKQVIETLGGIEVEVPRRYCDRWPKGGYHCVNPGRQWMDADEALWYARARSASNDFSRMQRQQQVMRAVLRRLLDLHALQQAPKLYRLFRDMVETNVTPEDMPRLLWTFRRFRMEHMATYVIKPPYVHPWIKPSGAYVLIPDKQAIQRLLMEAFSR